MFSTLSKTKIIILSTVILSSANAFNLDQSKSLLFGKEFKASVHTPFLELLTPQTFFQARKEAMSSRRKMLLDQLFDKWDNDGSGYLDQDEVENVMMKYKDGLENEAIEIGLLIAFYQNDPFIISLLRNTDF